MFSAPRKEREAPRPISNLHLKERTEGIRKELAAGKEAFDADAVADLLANIDLLDVQWSLSVWTANDFRAERDDYKARLIEVTEALQAARTRLNWIEQQGAERNSHMASECDNDSAID
jgi:hypothetical protein